MRILIPVALVLMAASGRAQERQAVHFHHIHLNSTNPAAAIDFYTSKFDCEKAKYNGAEAVRTQKSWILFNKVEAPPRSEILSAIWHFGWGAEDMPAAYDKQVASGTRFETPLTDISDLAGKSPGSFFFAYVDGPDHALIELNTAVHHRFGHIHLLSDDPVAAGEWYKQHLRMTGYISPRTPRVYRGFHVEPVASLHIDNVNVIIFPAEYARDAWPGLWRDRGNFESTEARVVDHLAFTVENLTDMLARLRQAHITITEQTKGTAFIEGPDRIRIELVEGPARRD